MRLIDVDELVLDYSGLCLILPMDFSGIAEYFADQIKAAPTITPESLVRHGRWVREKDEPPYCSECFEDATFTSGHYYHCTTFCPNCGAKMDSEENYE